MQYYVDELLMCIGGVYMPGQPNVVANGMMGMTTSMQVSMCIRHTVVI